MDQTRAPNEVQGLNMDQASHETQAPNGTPVNEGQPLTEILTPFGSPIDPASASLLAQNPLGWHLHYWRNLKILGMHRDVDPVLMEFRIEVEQMLKLDPQLRREIRQARAENRSTIHADVMRSCNEAARDIDHMLANKGHKTRVCLRGLERFMLLSMQAGNTDTAGMFFRKISDVYRRLRAEEEREAARRFSYDVPQWR